MCLQLDAKSSEQLQGILEARGYVPVWKLLRDKNRTLLTPYRDVPVRLVDGFFCSNRSRTELTTKEIATREVHQGIHVYLHPPNHEVSLSLHKGKGYAKDFVAADALGSAVFSKIELDLTPAPDPKKEYLVFDCSEGAFIDNEKVFDSNTVAKYRGAIRYTIIMRETGA